MRPSSTLAILLVVMLGYSFRGGVVPGSKDGHQAEKATIPAAKVTTAATKTAPRTDKTPSMSQCVLDEYFGRRYGTASHFRIADATRAGRVRFLIATIPDPVHSHQGLLTDRALEAIQEAASASGYVFDRAMLPWKSPDSPSTSPSQAAACQNSENDPGVLIFHRENPDLPDADLVVLLAGETATSGIHKEQFSRALDIIRDPSEQSRHCVQWKEATKADNKQDMSVNSSAFALRLELHGGSDRVCSKWAGIPSLPSNIDILGPTYSGSYYSLEALLEQNLGPHAAKWPALRIRSGTTLSHKLIGSFREWLKSKGQDNFLTFNQDDESQIAALIDFVEDRGFDPSKDVAVLRENESGFGTAGKLGVLQLSYPRGIAHLREAYSQDKDLGGGARSDNIPRSVLKLDLDSPGSDDDSVPEYAPKQTPVSAETELMQAMTLLSLHKPMFVVVVGSDPVDMLFVTKFLRKNYNRGRIVTLGADQLFARDPNETELHGVLSLTNYPLLPLYETEATEAPHRHLEFPDSVSAGVYNAALELMKEPVHSNCRATVAIPAADYFEYAAPVVRLPGNGRAGHAENRAGLWLNVVGDDGYWPFAWLGRTSGNELAVCTHCAATRRIEEEADFSTINKLVASMLMVAHLVLLIFLVFGKLRETSAYDQQFCPLSDHWRNGLSAAISCALVFCLLLLVPYYYDSNVWATRMWHYGILFFAAACTLSMVAVLCMRRAYIQASVYCAIIFGLAMWWKRKVALYSVTEIADRNGFFYFARYRDAWLLSKVSPTLPLLFLAAAIVWAAWYLLRARSMFDARRPFLPPCGTRLPSEEAWYREQTWPVITGGGRFVMAACLLLACALFSGAVQWAGPSWPYVKESLLSSLEGRRYDSVYLMVFATCCLLLLNILWSAGATWRAGKRLLVVIDRTQLRYALDNVKEFSWKPLWGLGLEPREMYRPILRALETLHHLGASLASAGMWGELRYLDNRRELILAGMQQIRHQQQNATATFYKTLRDNDKLLLRWQRLQRNLAIMCVLVYSAVLQRAWDNDVRLSTYRETEDKKSPAPVTASAAYPAMDSPPVQLAQEFVSLVYVNFLYRIIMRIRWLALAATGIYVFLLLSATWYPFEPQDSVRAFFVVLLLAIGVFIVTIYAQMHRDPVLSYLTDTKPGKLGGDFYVHVLSLGAIPVFTLLATAIPSLGHFLFTWLQPVVGALQTK